MLRKSYRIFSEILQSLAIDYASNVVFEAWKISALMSKCVLHAYWEDVVLSTQVNDMVKVH